MSSAISTRARSPLWHKASSEPPAFGLCYNCVTQTSAIRQPQNDDRDQALSLISRLKGGGYLVSTASVVLLAIPGIKAAMETPILFVCLIGGAAASIGGMYLRWRSHRLEQKEK